MDEELLVKFVDAFRLSIESPANLPTDGSHQCSDSDWEELLSQGLLQLRPAAFDVPEEDYLPLDEQTQEQALRAYPSVRCYSQLLARLSHIAVAVAFLLCLQCRCCCKCTHRRPRKPFCSTR